MSAEKLTTAEARRLIEMTKRALIDKIRFPTRGTTEAFDVSGDTKSDLFTINIFRGKIQRAKYNLGARIKKNGIMLLELHIGPTQVHTNPDGEKILGNHWHIYSAEYGRAKAFAASDINEDDFVDNTINFLKTFNVIESPEVLFQLELV